MSRASPIIASTRRSTSPAAAARRSAIIATDDELSHVRRSAGAGARGRPPQRHSPLARRCVGRYRRYWRDRSSAGDRRALPPLRRVASRRRRLWRAFRLVRRGPGAACAASTRRTASRSTRTRPCSCPTAPAPSSCATAGCCRRRSAPAANISGRSARSEVGPSPADLSPELTRHFRALRLWLPLQIAGIAAFRAAQSEKLALARYFHARLSRDGRVRRGTGAAIFRSSPSAICPRAATSMSSTSA